ncbi:LysR family transcriptional regulator [Cohnella nanjingensis]|uniref:LysR family transcriptional regulator n=1 Tax=Cohnella nanjingensis TaxID=1387779 RepID=A0A7X0RR01_9BACL|nr:LysR family transcriptional regulator [Cohnella nanjingensis]MBB6672063.1 LysR family transcriptional regulator [Cohnella nanjingensis]
MELLQLRYFRTVARLEHMTQAAQKLRIAQPALSKTIARLEEDVGVPLFDRGGGRIRLNRFGKAYLDKVEKALNLLEEGQREVSELAGLEQGSIHLVTSTVDRLSEPLHAFVARYPDIHFRISQARPDEMAQLLESGEVDLVFAAMPIDRPGLTMEIVLSEELYLAVPKGHRFADRARIHLREAANEPFIGYKEDFIFQRMNDAFFEAAGFAPNFVCRVDEPPAVASLVRAGLGLALYACQNRESVDMQLLSIESPVCQRQYRLIWHDKRYLSLAARKFRDFVLDYFAEGRAALEA